MVPGSVVDGLLRWIAGDEAPVWVVGHGHVASHVLPMLRDRGLAPLQLGARALDPVARRVLYIDQLEGTETFQEVIDRIEAFEAARTRRGWFDIPI